MRRESVSSIWKLGKEKKSEEKFFHEKEENILKINEEEW